MKKRYLFLILSLLSFSMVLRAQEAGEGEQLLVFRNTGVVDLLYTNEVDSILTNESTQVFYAKDTVLVVPLAELDSVAVGNRNVREIKSEVHELTDERDLPWLIRVEGNHIFYRLDTPQDILPKVDDKLFYGGSHELFPIGISAKVVRTTRLAQEIDVEIEPVELHEIFDRFFYAGRVTMSEMPAEARYMMSRANHDRKVIPIEGKLEVEGYGEMYAHCQLELLGDYVINVFSNYYHGHIKGEFSGEVGAKLKCDENTECHSTIPILHLPLPAVAGILYPSVYVNLFTDFNAELNMNFSARKVYRFEYDWTRKDGEQSGKVVEPTEGPAEDEEIKTDLTLEGQLHMGAQAGVGLNLIGNRVGFRFESKLGPCLEGELGIGVLSKMRDFNSELWHKAELSTSIKLIFMLSYLRHEIFYIFGDEVVEPITTCEFSLFKDTHHLFPNYTHTRAVAMTNRQEEVKSDMATAVLQPPPTDIETGFEIINGQGEVVDSVFAGMIKTEPEDTTVAQTFDAEIPLPSTIKQEDLDNYTMRPIFHYAGYTVSAAPVDIKNDVLIQPYTAKMCNGAMTLISSGPFLGSAEKDSTLYQVGAYLPVPLKNNVYKKNGFTIIKMGKHIDSGGANYMVGTWQGMIGEKEVTLILKSDFTGSYDTSRTFKYELNTPQSGDLQLTFDNGETSLFRVLSVTENELKMEDKRQKDSEVIVLEKVSQE